MSQIKRLERDVARLEVQRDELREENAELRESLKTRISDYPRCYCADCGGI